MDFYRNDNEIVQFTLSSFIRGYHIYQSFWTPMLGDTVICVAEPNNKYDKTAVATLINNRICGHVPAGLSTIFARFLNSQGSIHAKVVGNVIDRGYGLEVPVEYIFIGYRIEIARLTQVLYRDVEDHCSSPVRERTSDTMLSVDIPPPPSLSEEENGCTEKITHCF